MWTVLQRENIHEFLEFIPLAQQLGFSRLTFTLNMTDWGQEHWTKANGEATIEDSITPDIAEQAISDGLKLGVEVTFWDVGDKNSTRTQDSLCQWPFQWAFISSDMRVAPCAIISNPDTHELGDARTFTETWNSDTFKAFRQAHLDGKIPKICTGCYEHELLKVNK